MNHGGRVSTESTSARLQCTTIFARHEWASASPHHQEAPKQWPHQHAIQHPARCFFLFPLLCGSEQGKGARRPQPPCRSPCLQAHHEGCRGCEIFANGPPGSGMGPRQQARQDKQTLRPAQAGTGSQDHGPGGDVVLVHTHVSDVDGQREPRDQQEPLAPENGVPCHVGMERACRGPNGSDERSFEPNHAAQSARQTWRQCVGQRGQNQGSPHRHQRTQLPRHQLPLGPCEKQPEASPNRQHGKAMAVPISSPFRRHGRRGALVLDSALDGVPTTCGKPHPNGDGQVLRRVDGAVVGPVPSQPGGGACPQGDPEVRKRHGAPDHGTKVEVLWTQNGTWWTGC